MIFTAELEKNFSFPVSNGLLDEKHYKQLGMAIWEFLWLIDKITEEIMEGEECWGKVLGGKAICAEDLASIFGSSTDTVKRNLKKLKEYGYIREKRLPRGKAIDVRKSIKWRMRFHDASTSSNASTSGLDRLVAMYRNIPGVVARSRDCGVIGKLVQKYSEEVVSSAIRTLEEGMAKRHIESPLGYLTGIIEKKKATSCPMCKGTGTYLKEVPLGYEFGFETKTISVNCELCRPTK